MATMDREDLPKENPWTVITVLSFISLLWPICVAMMVADKARPTD